MFKKACLENRITITFQIRHIIIEHLTYINVKCSWRVEKDGKSDILIRHNFVLIFSISFNYFIFSYISCINAKVRKGWTGLWVFYFFSSCCILHLISTQVAWKKVFFLVWWSSRSNLFHDLEVFYEL